MAGRTPQPIQQSEILSYFETFYIESLWERETLQRVIRQMDAAYLREMAKKHEFANRPAKRP